MGKVITVWGSPGSGKSMSCKSEIVSVFLTTADDIFISDPEDEYYPLNVEACTLLMFIVE